MKLLAAVAAVLLAAAPALFPFLHNNDLILFQGDSITDGGRQRTGSDYNHIMGQDYAYILAGALFQSRTTTPGLLRLRRTAF